MLDIDGLNIRLTRGDTARLTIPIKNVVNNTQYSMAAGDKLILTVKRNEQDSRPAFEKVSNGTNKFHILPSDTSRLPFGKYVYDIELRTASGDVYTVIELSTFEIAKEVTCG